MSYDYDLFVIGGGSGGIAAARRAAGYGAKVGLAEVDRLGGTCVNRGCIPKKLMVYASHFPDFYEDATGYGWSPVNSQLDWPHLVSAIDKELRRLNDIYVTKLAEVDIHRTYSRLLDPHTVEAGDRKVTADKILIAVGGKPVHPSIQGIEHAVSSDAMFSLPEQPKRMLAIGSGYIASEFACILHHLGTEVTQFTKHDLILKGFDDDLREHLQNSMGEQGIRILQKSQVGWPVQIERVDSGLKVCFEQGDPIEVDLILSAVGRRPNLEKLGLENADVETSSGAIAVDEHSRTTQPNIYAVGDCTNRVNLTPVAIREGRAFVDTEYGKQPWVMSHENVPSAIFTTPEAASVGLGEAQARERYGNEAIDTYRARFAATYYALTPRRQRSMLKLVVERDSDRVLGVHMVGDHAAEIIQGMAIAVKMGAKKADFNATVGIHPSVAEEFVTM
ncbi:pyruvate/2-oxoglutarate dehydrogenase complex [Rubidibacter lacunae KORDI 51-2]|uniref:Pyruvate/2-oxoglutarate dehydrogenase complex n=1 Tax=Rubidibacter lacunae KORDI 51-2 TaxID=582515 RepID=U5DF86_9CHRO|nr:glutathione-disulfide reductase [Rubidibacter lacunae]ERN43153.1 pyruvate/2-oxoglutarate dehydrogenase complex [Rubidibacter lacunae KORDI 51-2]